MSLQSSAQLRRGGQRDDRRRRLLADECLGVGSAAVAAAGLGDTPPARKSANYGDAARLGRQIHLIDLVPRRAIAVALLCLAGLASVAALEVVYVKTRPVPPEEAQLAAFDLAARGSLGSWFSSLVLLAASIAAIQVYSIRRHKTDDYQGRYRVWRWAALCWFLLAADVATSLHEGLQRALLHWTGTKLVGDGSIWWILPFVLLFGAVSIRLLIDMRRCRLSTAALAGTTICYAAAGALRFGWLPGVAGPRRVMFEAGAGMLASVFLLLAMGLHARFEILDAEGSLPRPKRKPRKARPKAGEGTNGGLSRFSSDENGTVPLGCAQESPRTSPIVSGAAKIDPPHATPPPSAAHIASAPAPVAAPAAQTPAGGKLSKADRKALRQRLEQERLKREARQQSNWKK